MTKLRVGVVGLGRGQMFVDLFRERPDCEVVAVCDPVEQMLGKYSEIVATTSYDEFLATDPDIVAVISPGPVHAGQSVKAMEAGAHVLCETPCVYSVDEATSVVETSEKTGRKYMLAEDYLWMGWAVKIKQMAEEGLFGEIVYAEGDYTHDCRDFMLKVEFWHIPYSQWKENPEAVKTWRATDLPPIYYTSHTLGPLLHAMDDRIVSAVGMSTGSHTAPDLGTIDVETAIFQTEKGSVVRLTNGFTVAHPYSLYYNLVGTKGSLKLHSTGGGLFTWYSEMTDPPMTGWEDAPDSWKEREDGKNHVAVMVDEFVDAVVNDTPPPIDVARSLDFVLPGIIAHESAMKGSRVMEVPGEFRPGRQ